MARLQLPFSREEIRALDSMIRAGRPLDEQLTPEQRVVLSVWNGIMFDLFPPTPLSTLEHRPKDELERWFDSQDRKR